MSLLRAFHLFPRLPEELQIEIWKCATQTQRIISIERLHFSYEAYFHHHHATHNPPAMLHACHLSRLVGLENYQILAQDYKLRHPIYFSPASDVIYCGGLSSYKMIARESQVLLGPDSGIRFMVFKAGDMDCMAALWTTIEVPSKKRGLIALYTLNEGVRGIYHCGQCGCKVSQIYGLEFNWTTAEASKVKEVQEWKYKDIEKAKETLNIRVLGRREIDREFGNGPWNRNRCLACPSQQGLIWTGF
ncbi:hypothetical protein N431DRAFT_521216 [Stipitochalara longipes BDJ]|nr:hypothetical protein N431DRAFT_521216 [Stipitochalara longipes BDJ]